MHGVVESWVRHGKRLIVLVHFPRLLRSSEPNPTDIVRHNHLVGLVQTVMVGPRNCHITLRNFCPRCPKRPTPIARKHHEARQEVPRAPAARARAPARPPTPPAPPRGRAAAP